MMKKHISLLLCAAMLLGFIALPVSAVTDIEAPTDVPKIVITTTDEIIKDDYVTATIKVIDEEGGKYATIEDSASSIKIRGNSTSSADKKPYNIKFSSKTDVLGMGKNKKWCLLANCYDKTLLRNMTVFDFANMLGIPYTPDYRVVDVYVNTAFMGCYLITDAVEVSSTRVDIDIDNNEFLLELDYNPEDEDSQYFYSPTYNIKFAINEPEKEDLTEEQLTWVTNFMTEAEAALASCDYEAASQYFDMESLVNFYITLELFKNVDVNTSSTRFHIKGGKIYGGPVWDFDLSAGNCNDDYYTGYNNYTTNDIQSNKSYEGIWAQNVPWFEQLMSVTEFQNAVYLRYLELQDEIINLYANNEHGANAIDHYIGKYANVITRNNDEWEVNKVYNANLQLERDPDNTYEEHIAFYRHWLQMRNEWLLDEWELTTDHVDSPTDVPKVIITTTDEIIKDDYVTATIKVLDEIGGNYATIEDTASEIKIRGNSTSSADKKPYNIKFSSKTDVLGMGKNKKWCLLANCYDKTLLRNITVFDFANEAGIPYTPDYRVVDVYVNTTFMGSYLITDAIEVSSTRVDIDTDNNEFLLELDYNTEDEDCQYFYSSTYNIKFAINEPEKEDLTEEQLAWVTNFMTEAEAALASGDYEAASQYFDMESLVNFYITLEFFKNVDVNTSSTRFHIKDGMIYGGPVWDFDLSAGNCNFDYYKPYNNAYTTGNSYEGLWAQNVPWFDKLMTYEAFQTAVFDRYLDLQDEIANLYEDNELGQNRIDYYLEIYKGTINRNHNEAGWTVDKVYNANLQLERTPDNTYEKNIAFYRNWLSKRNEWLLDRWNLTDESIELPTDVPKVIITTTDEINRDSYVDATIKIIDEEGSKYATIVDSASSIKIRGNSTSSADKKPYNIKFSSKTDVLGMGNNKKWCLLANCYDKTLLRNMTVFDFAKLAGVPYTSDYRVVDVYVNGTFMGCYLITDAVEVSSTRVDIDTDNNEYLLELDYNPEDEDSYYFYSPTYNIKFAINEPEKEDLTEEQIAWVTDFITQAESALASGNYTRISEYFDIDSFVNFYITLEFFKNVDVNLSSTRFHIKDGKIYGGPVWDFDLSSGNCNDDYYTTYNNYTTNDIDSNTSYQGIWATSVPWFAQLMNDSTFKQLVYDRYLELQDEIINLYSDNLSGQNRIDYYLDTYAGTISRNHNNAGWDVDELHNPIYATGEGMQLERDPFDQSYEDHIDFFRNWLQKRNEWLLGNWGLTSLIEQESFSSCVVNGFFVSITDKTRVSALLSDFGEGVTVTYNGSALSGTDYVPSGAILSAGGASYAVILKGDVYEDGRIDAYDYIVIKRFCLKTMSPDNINTLAADVSGNGRIDAIDFIMLKRHVLGTYNIFE